MRYLTSNLFFTAIVIMGIGTLIWYLFTDSPKTERHSILSVVTDLIFYFILTLLGVNVVFHLNEIIETPYRILLFSSNVVSIATLIVAIYSALSYGNKLWENPKKAVSAEQLFLFIGLVNHIYYYLLYRNFQSILFIGFFILLLFLTSSDSILKKIDPLLLISISSAIHFLLMNNQPVIYFNFTFYAVPLLIILFVFVCLLYVLRRKQQSKQN